MELTITTKNMTLNDSVEQYARKRLAKLDRRLRHSIPVRLTLRHERTRDAGQRYIAEITATLKGALLRGEERASTITAAIDGVSDVVDRQIGRYKTRRLRHRRGGPNQLEADIAAQFTDEPGEEAADDPLEDAKLVRVKHHSISPMTVIEAATQMDLLGHSFFVFVNSEAGEVNVVYRRDDGDYGLIVAEEERG